MFDPTMQTQIPPMNASDLFMAQNLGLQPQQPQMPSAPQMQQPMMGMSQQAPQQSPEMQHLSDVLQQYTNSKQSQQNNTGLVQQILSNRMQPTLDDASQSTAQTAQSFLAPNLFRPQTPDQAMAERYQNQLAPYTQGLNLANQSAELSGRLMQNDITQQTGLPMAQADLQGKLISNQYAPQLNQSEINLRGAQIPLMNAETQNKNITNQYLPQSLLAEIAAKNAQAALASGSNIFVNGNMGNQAGFGAGASPTSGNLSFPTGGMSIPVNGQAQPQVQTTQNGQQGQSGQVNEQFLSQLTPQAAQQVKALAEGRMAFPSGFALKTPYWQNMLSAVSTYDPNFDAVNYNARAASRKSFTSGADANNIAALNTAMSHLATLSDAYSTLGNTDYPYLNQAKNFLGNTFGDTTVQTNTANVNVDAEAVSHELAKVFRSSGMSEGEIDAWKKQISTSAGPAQSSAIINSALNLMDGRLQALGAKYNQGMGTTSDPIQLLSPEAQAAYSKLRTVAKPNAQPASTSPGVVQWGRDAQGMPVPLGGTR